MKKAGIYIRVSTDKQAQEGDSVAAQKEALTKYVSGRSDLRLAGVYIDDGISGTKADRDELNHLLEDVQQGKINAIFFTKLDRWFRSVRHYTATQEILDRHGVTWTAIWESIYDTSTPQGRLIVNQMMSIAQFEAENTGQRIRQVQAYKVTQGEVISGMTPPGYTIRDKHMVKNDTAPAVLEAFQHYSYTGSINVTMTLTAGKGLPTTHTAFKNMLTNVKYTGKFRGNDKFCEPIVPQELFDDVQRKLKMNVKKSQRHTYIFSGLIKCGECGRNFGGNARKRTRGNSTTLRKQYRCPGHFQGGISRCINTKVIDEHALEVYLMDNLRPHIQGIKLKYTFHAKQAEDSTNQIKAIEKKITRLKELYVNGLITMDEYKHDRDGLENQISILNGVKRPDLPDMALLDNLLAKDIEALYWGFSDEEKRYFWRSILREIRMGVDRVYHVL